MPSINLDDLYNSLPPVRFAALFCSRLRKEKELQNAVSSRQAIAISKLLIATCFRKNSLLLLPDDYIRAAVITTAPEDQAIARKVAVNILFPQLKKRQLAFDKKQRTRRGKQDLLSDVLDESSKKKKGTKALSKEVLDGLADFLDEMAEDFATTTDETSESGEYLDEFDFYFSVVSKWKNKAQPFHSLLNSLDSPTDVLMNKFSSLNELVDFVNQKLLSTVGQIPTEQLEAIPHCTVLPSIASSKNPVEKMIAQYSMGQQEAFQKAVKTMKKDDPVAIAKIAKALRDADVMPQQDFQELVEEAANSSETSSEIYNVIRNARTMNDLIKNQLFDVISQEQSLVRPIAMTASLEKYTEEPLCKDFLRAISKEPDLDKRLSHEALEHIPIYNKKFEKAIEESIRNALNKLGKKAQPQAYERYFDSLQETQEKTKNPYYQKLLKESINLTGNDWMKSFQSKKQFLNKGHQLIRQGVELDPKEMFAHGTKIGCSEEELNEMLFTDFEALLNAIKKGDRDYTGYLGSINNLGLNTSQFKIATGTAISSQNKAAMAALASVNLQEASAIAQQSGAQEMLLSSLSAGSGENLLKQWFVSRDAIPSAMRKKMKEILKKVVISTAMDMARLRLGSAEAGVMVSNQTRPYREGDELDQIDIDNTLENIIAAGKNLDQIIADDFMMHDLKKGRIALLILLDISGSMTGVERLSYCAFMVTMLIARLREQEVAVALFESDTHVLLELMEEKPEIDQVIDELLELRARGGTVINKALTWAHEQFKKINEEKLYFMVVSDFELYYNVRKSADFTGLKKMNPKTYLVAPGGARNNRELKDWEKAFGAHVILIKEEREIIDSVCKIITNR